MKTKTIFKESKIKSSGVGYKSVGKQINIGIPYDFFRGNDDGNKHKIKQDLQAFSFIKGRNPDYVRSVFGKQRHKASDSQKVLYTSKFRSDRFADKKCYEFLNSRKYDVSNTKGAGQKGV
jgi:hypothetical protein